MNTLGRVAYRRVGLWRKISRLPVKAQLAWKDWSEAREAAVAATKGPSARERHDQLIAFYSHYETLVEILCNAANLGATSKLQDRYAHEREWMQLNYGDLQPFLIAYLRFDVSDTSQIKELAGEYGDAFEALYAAPDLESFLKADDGHMIDRIVRTRDALSLCGDHLRRLVAAEKCA